MRVVVVEDDAGMAEAVIDGLREHGFGAVDHLSHGLDLLTSYTAYDAVILDLGLPDLNGYLVLRQLRKVSDIPVVVLTAEGDESAVVSCLRAGADDYMVKPPRIGELAARLESITRRWRAAEPEQAVVVSGDVTVNLTTRSIEVAGEPISLTQKEFAVCRVLVEHVGVPVGRDKIITEVWGARTPPNSRSLDVHMGALRAKLNRPGLIVTIHGFGYRWSR
ncbi:response regulator transcription factor [Nocardia sp. NPDC052566]|uniref:response regulator transcription factor n=1 Tax=Nocardia sp. NPDC052566 TaxID=3364330 RepID=UPI0037C8D3FA